MKTLTIHIKPITIILSLLNFCAAISSLLIGLINYIDLSVFFIIEFLIVLLYIFITIYTKWINEQLRDLKQYQISLLSKIDNHSAQFNSQIQTLQSAIDSSQEKLNESLSSQFLVLAAKQTSSFNLLKDANKSSEDNLKSKLIELIDKQTNSFSSIEQINKHSQNILKTQLAELIDKQTTSLNSLQKANKQSEENLKTQLVELIDKQTTSFNSIEKENKQSEENLKHKLIEIIDKQTTSFNSIEEANKQSEDSLKAQLIELINKQTNSFDSIEEVNKLAGNHIKNQLIEIIDKQTASFNSIEEANKLADDHLKAELIDLIDKQTISLNSIEETNKLAEDNLKAQLADLMDKQTTSFNSIEKENKLSEDNLKAELVELMDNQTTSFSSIEETNKKSESHLKAQLIELMNKQTTSINSIEEVNKLSGENLKVQLIELMDKQVTSFNSIKEANKLSEYNLKVQLIELIDKQTTSFNSVEKANEQSENKLKAQLIELIEKQSRKQYDTLNQIKEHLTASTRKIEQLPSQFSKDIENQKGLLNNKLVEQLNITYDRIDALLSIHNLIELNAPLPIMHDWRVSSDYAHSILNNLLGNKGSVIDIGSGISTILMGYALKQNGSGRVVSLEHSKEYYEKTKNLIKKHQLENWCELHYCPLKEHIINGEKWLWYDIDKVKLPNDVILISTDGPPGITQYMARFPAVPLLKKCITKKTSIFIDDGDRKEEKEIAIRWSKEFNLKHIKHDSHKGFFELTKK